MEAWQQESSAGGTLCGMKPSISIAVHIPCLMCMVRVITEFWSFVLRQCPQSIRLVTVSVRAHTTAPQNRAYAVTTIMRLRPRQLFEPVTALAAMAGRTYKRQCSVDPPARGARWAWQRLHGPWQRGESQPRALGEVTNWAPRTRHVRYLTKNPTSV